MRFLVLLLVLAVGIWLGLHRGVGEMLKKLWHYIKTPECTNVVITVATVVIAIWAGLQWWEMHGAGQQTKDLITAANSQARAADRFATSASNIKTTIGQAEKDFQAIADSSKHSIKATQDAMRLEQRAWINVTARIPLEIKEDTGITGSAHIVNTGRTPAKNVIEQFVIERVKKRRGPSFSLSRFPRYDCGDSLSECHQRFPGRLDSAAARSRHG